MSNRLWSVILDNGYKVTVPLYYATTAIFDEGGVGKSYIFQKLKDLKEQQLLDKNTLLIDRTKASDCDWITQIKNVFVVIDDWDVVCIKYPAVIDILNSQRYQVLILGRNIDMLRLNRDYVFRLKVDHINKIINAVSVFDIKDYERR